jgi:hypothetical protein
MVLRQLRSRFPPYKTKHVIRFKMMQILLLFKIEIVVFFIRKRLSYFLKSVHLAHKGRNGDVGARANAGAVLLYGSLRQRTCHLMGLAADAYFS